MARPAAVVESEVARIQDSKSSANGVNCGPIFCRYFRGLHSTGGGGCQLIRLFMHSTRRPVFCSSPPQDGQSRGHQTARGQ